MHEILSYFTLLLCRFQPVTGLILDNTATLLLPG